MVAFDSYMRNLRVPGFDSKRRMMEGGECRVTALDSISADILNKMIDDDIDAKLNS
jgi:hypothetical protein